MAVPRSGNYWSDEDPRRSAAGIADWIPELLHNLVAQSWAISLLHGAAPGLDLAKIADALQPECELARAGGPPALLPVAPSVSMITSRSGQGAYDSQGAFVSQASIVLIQLGDALQWSGVHQRLGSDPLLQFMRHVRNGLGHGSYFHFDRKVDFDRQPAQLRDIRLSREYEGKAVFSLLRPGDVLDLLEDLHRFLSAAGDA